MAGLVYRRIALTVPAFDVLKELQREWGTDTNNETLTRVLMTYRENRVNNFSEAQTNEEETAATLLHS